MKESKSECLGRGVEEEAERDDEREREERKCRQRQSDINSCDNIVECLN